MAWKEVGETTIVARARNTLGRGASRGTDDIIGNEYRSGLTVSMMTVSDTPRPTLDRDEIAGLVSRASGVVVGRGVIGRRGIDP